MLFIEPRWKSYVVKTSQPVFTPQQCDELIAVGQKEPKIDSGIGGKDKANHHMRKSNISWIPFNTAKPMYTIIERLMLDTNVNHFGFDGMQITELAQYTEYSKGGFYDWHMDSGVVMSTMPMVRKISMTLLLTDTKDFEGGELELFIGNKLDSKENKINIKQGEAVFFASFLLHRVAPVTKGNRKALVMWFGGTPLR